jgi:sulfur-carrier protein
MRVTVKLFAQFQKGRFAIRELDAPADVIIQDILEQFEIPEKAVGVMMVNGRHATASRQLMTDDVLAVFPVIGGG